MMDILWVIVILCILFKDSIAETINTVNGNMCTERKNKEKEKRIELTKLLTQHHIRQERREEAMKIYYRRYIEKEDAQD